MSISPTAFTQFLDDILVPKSTLPIAITNISTKKITKIPVNSFPLCLLRVITTDGVQFDIPQVLAFSTQNSLNPNELPEGQVTFVLSEGEVPPAIGPNSEIYLYADYFESNVYDTSGSVSAAVLHALADDSGQIVNRVFTALATECNKIRDTRMGKIYQLTFNSFIKKLHTTNEQQTLAVQAPTPGTNRANNLPASVRPSMQLDYPGQLVQIAMQQSNLAYAYIYLPTGSLQNAALSDSPSLSQDIVTDIWGTRTSNKHFPLKSLIPIQNSLAEWQYQRWIQILGSSLDMSFCELFCNKFGQAYFRQAAMFRPAGDWDIEVPGDLAIGWRIGENDRSIITRLEVRSPSPVIQPYLWGPPDMDRLEQRYSGPRYNLVQIPWAIFALAKEKKENPVASDQNHPKLDSWIRDFATFVLALANTSAVQGTITLVGSNAFDVGQTIYFAPEDIVLYITDVKQDFIVGDKWTTTLTVNYGRSRDVDFLGYLAKGVSIIGAVETIASASTGTTFVGGVPTVGSDQVDLSDLPTTFNQGNPFGQYNYIISNPWGAHDGNTGEPEGHTGIDLIPVNSSCSAIDNAPILSLTTGVVTGMGAFMGANAGWGNYVCIQTGNLIYSYCHLSAYAHISIGTNVGAGDPIGTMGQTGHASGPHLHFQVEPASNTRGVQPGNHYTRSVNPWNAVSPSGFSQSCEAGSPWKYSPPSTFTTTSDAPTFIPSITQNGVQLYEDTNYWADVKLWAQGLAQGSLHLGAPTPDVIAFFVALSLQEIGDPSGTHIVGNQFAGLYNFMNANTGITPVPDGNGGYVDNYSQGMAQAITAAQGYFNSGRYTSFVVYMNANAGNISAKEALTLLIKGGFKGSPTDAQIERSLANVDAAWQSVMIRLFQ